jgi:hypothetical protein
MACRIACGRAPPPACAASSSGRGGGAAAAVRRPRALLLLARSLEERYKEAYTMSARARRCLARAAALAAG